jgi:hypothetical protein
MFLSGAESELLASHTTAHTAATISPLNHAICFRIRGFGYLICEVLATSHGVKIITVNGDKILLFIILDFGF